jgi:hypothetical protein
MKNDYRKFLKSSIFWDKNFGQQTAEEETTREDVDLDGRETMDLRETEFDFSLVKRMLQWRFM